MTKILSFIKEILEKCSYVNWDRYVIYKAQNDYCAIYGWIEREDSYKDFAIIEFDLTNKQVNFTLTSSVKYSDQFNKDTGGLNIEHNHCKRVEDVYDIKNMVRLNDKNK